MKPDVIYFESLTQLSHAAAGFLSEEIQLCVREKNICSLVLTGGRTPVLLYEFLARPPFSDLIPWEKVHIFWGDERWVPATAPDSNFNMAEAALLSRVAIPAENIHRIPTELDSPAAAADAYEKTIHNFYTAFSATTPSNGLPGFDLVLLGMGQDGHIASLFPNDPLLSEQDRLVAAVDTPKGSPPVPRITLTLPSINKTSCVFFLTTGSEKQKILDAIEKDKEKASLRYPAALIRPEGRWLWFSVGHGKEV